MNNSPKCSAGLRPVLALRLALQRRSLRVRRVVLASTGLEQGQGQEQWELATAQKQLQKRAINEQSCVAAVA